ncbi:membrane protein insertase YidC [Idiomarina xiamenensis]|uniref:Membrane protein insertase YidC n=1 Tax=Idiomarina xiamenensis 10-D-4 TaxID=740709 RepID=K2L0A0_9GAMM|nr:membrane protein insertase YidC [Idiomarina xiamenensis]EKE83360.1 preprotein translocase subunit YidC [Idiomarina xiamenensis 10-D-4]
MNSPRSILLIAFLVVSFFLYQTWMVETAPGTERANQTSQTSTSTDSNMPRATSGGDSVPSATNSSSSVPGSDNDISANSDRYVRVQTDVFDAIIDRRGGDIISAELMQFSRSLESDAKFQLLHNQAGDVYIAQSGLIGADGTDSNRGRPTFSTEKSEYTLTGDSLTIPMTFTTDDGSTIKKLFTFTRNSYAIDVAYEVTNASDSAKTMQFYGQLKQSMNEGSGSMVMPTYRGAAYSSDNERYEKYTFDDIKERSLNITTNEGWAGMLEHYFASAWIPRQSQENRLFTQTASNNQAVIGIIEPAKTIAPGQTETFVSTLYAGPKDQDSMAEIAPHLDLTVDYGILWWLAQPLFKLLQFLHGIVLNWGLAIVLTTVIIKALLFPLTKAQYVSMAKMRMIQPKMQSLRERYGDDRQKMSQAMMKLYKEEKVNPIGGCFPMLLQLPIFLALYWVLLESVELRHSPLFLWINDLSAKDPYYVLPILMGISMFVMQRLQPTPTADPMQQKLLTYMPVVFTVFFLWFPAGLVLYWLVSNLITIAQMQIIYRGLEKKGLMVRGNRKKK